MTSITEKEKRELWRKVAELSLCEKLALLIDAANDHKKLKPINRIARLKTVLALCEAVALDISDAMADAQEEWLEEQEETG